jgi:repressor LexA
MKKKNRLGLTPKQKNFLDMIKYYIKKNGFSPSYEEMKQLMNFHSKSVVHLHVHQLEERGYITLKKAARRSISVL